MIVFLEKPCTSMPCATLPAWWQRSFPHTGGIVFMSTTSTALNLLPCTTRSLNPALTRFGSITQHTAIVTLHSGNCMKCLSAYVVSQLSIDIIDCDLPNSRAYLTIGSFLIKLKLVGGRIAKARGCCIICFLALI